MRVAPDGCAGAGSGDHTILTAFGLKNCDKYCEAPAL